jgi:hypothetical protein
MALSEEPQVGRRSFDARAAVVRRTHRIVRERAAAIQARKRTVRDLVVPFAICSALLLVIATAVWTVADEGLGGWEDGIWKRVLQLGSESGSSISLLLIWFLPLSVITAAVVLIRRSRASNANRQETR